MTAPVIEFDPNSDWLLVDAGAPDLADPTRAAREVLSRDGTNAKRWSVSALTRHYRSMFKIYLKPAWLTVAFLVPPEAHRHVVAAITLAGRRASDPDESGLAPLEAVTVAATSNPLLVQPAEVTTLHSPAGDALRIRTVSRASPQAKSVAIESLAAVWWFPEAEWLIFANAAFYPADRASRYRDSVQALLASSRLRPLPDGSPSPKVSTAREF